MTYEITAPPKVTAFRIDDEGVSIELRPVGAIQEWFGVQGQGARELAWVILADYTDDLNMAYRLADQFVFAMFIPAIWPSGGRIRIKPQLIDDFLADMKERFKEEFEEER